MSSKSRGTTGPTLRWGAVCLFAVSCGTIGPQLSMAADCSNLEAAALVHFQGPFTKTILIGAETAAAECGAPIHTQGPAAFDAQASLAQFNDVVAAGADVVSLVAYPGDFWVRPIDDAVRKGVTVTSYDAPSPESLASLHIAPSQYSMGEALADVVAEAIGGQSAAGTVVAGICIPGLDVLEHRVVGFKRRLAELAPAVTVVGAFDVSFDQTENLTRWSDLIAKNPEALAHVGFCANDLASLVRIKERDPGATYLIGSVGGDENPEGLRGIKDGVALVAIGQKPFMMGYVAMRAMLDIRAASADMPRGWIDLGPEYVTIENIDAVLAREESLASGSEGIKAYYQDQIDAIFADLPSKVQSFAALLQE